MANLLRTPGRYEFPREDSNLRLSHMLLEDDDVFWAPRVSMQERRWWCGGSLDMVYCGAHSARLNCGVADLCDEAAIAEPHSGRSAPMLAPIPVSVDTTYLQTTVADV